MIKVVELMEDSYATLKSAFEYDNFPAWTLPMNSLLLKLTFFLNASSYLATAFSTEYVISSTYEDNSSCVALAKISLAPADSFAKFDACVDHCSTVFAQLFEEPSPLINSVAKVIVSDS